MRPCQPIQQGEDDSCWRHGRFVFDPQNAPWESIGLESRDSWPIEDELRVNGVFSNARKPLPVSMFDCTMHDVNERLNDIGAPRLLEEVRLIIDASCAWGVSVPISYPRRSYPTHAQTCAACPLHRAAGVYRRQDVHWSHVRALQCNVASCRRSSVVGTRWPKWLGDHFGPKSELCFCRWAADIHDFTPRDELCHCEARQACQGGEGVPWSCGSSLASAADRGQRVERQGRD